jgi:hypothetical protein
MGQAKQRGTYEERRASAIVANALERITKEKTLKERLEKLPPKHLGVMLAAASALSEGGY